MPSPENGNWVLSPGRLHKELERTGFCQDTVDRLMEAARRALSLPDVAAKLEQIRSETLGGMRTKPHIPDHPLLPALAIVAAFPQARALHQARGIPDAVTNATLCDLGRSMEAYHAEHGIWGFDNIGWLRHHLTGGLFELGRLQYQPGTMGLPYRVYRSHRDAHLVALAVDQVSCSAEGFPQQGAGGFTTTWTADSHQVQGHFVCPESGKISPQSKDLALSDYELIADPTSHLLFVHIPKGPALGRADCDESFQKAALFFDRHFPERDWQGYGCISWLLDPELRQCLPAHSNILGFASRFLPLAVPNATGNQILERVLGVGVDPSTFQPRNSLQRAVVDHLRAGGCFRTTGGFIPRQDTPGAPPGH